MAIIIRTTPRRAESALGKCGFWRHVTSEPRHVHGPPKHHVDSSCHDMKPLIQTQTTAFSTPSNMHMTCKRKIDDELKRKLIKTCMPLNSRVLLQSMMANAARWTPSLNACKHNTIIATLLYSGSIMQTCRSIQGKDDSRYEMKQIENVSMT